MVKKWKWGHCLLFLSYILITCFSLSYAVASTTQLPNALCCQNCCAMGAMQLSILWKKDAVLIQFLSNSLWSDWRHLNEIISLLNKLPLKHPKHKLVTTAREGEIFLRRFWWRKHHQLPLKHPTCIPNYSICKLVPRLPISSCSDHSEPTRNSFGHSIYNDSAEIMGLFRSHTALHPDRPWFTSPDREAVWQNRKGKQNRLTLTHNTVLAWEEMDEQGQLWADQALCGDCHTWDTKIGHRIGSGMHAAKAAGDGWAVWSNLLFPATKNT